MKKELQEYLDSVIENVKDYSGRSFTYGTIVYNAFRYSNDLEVYYMPFDLKEKLGEYIGEYFSTMYLQGVEGKLAEMLEYADTTVYLELLDISEIQDIIEEIVEGEEE